MTIDIAKENDIRRLHDVEKWKPGTIVAELGVHSLDLGAHVIDCDVTPHDLGQYDRPRSST